MNYMSEVAQMLGVKLYENFRYKSALTGLSKIELRFTEKYLEGYSPDINAWFNVKFETICNLLNGEYEVVKLPEPILTEEERKYLSVVIKPYKEDIEYIVKLGGVVTNNEFLFISVKDSGYLNFPLYEKGTMYRGLKLDKEYTLEELDL